MLLEYGFLHNLNFEFNEDFETIVDLFDFGNRTIKEVKKSITDIHRLRGVEGFIWFAEEINQDDTFNLEFDTEIGVPDEDISTGIMTNSKNLEDDYLLEDIEIDKTIPKENYIFEKITTIPSGEKVVISNKIIDVDMILKISGELKFINCDIIFSEEYASILIEEGKLIFIHCNIDGTVDNEKEKFGANSDGTTGDLIFINCEIYNTNTFVNNEKLDVSFINSKISTAL